MPRMACRFTACSFLLTAFILLPGGCAPGGRVNLNPTVNLAVAPSSLAEQAAVYIPTLHQKLVHSQTLGSLGTIDVVLGPALIKCARESFQLFFGQVLMLGPSETTGLTWRIDLRTDRFHVTGNLGVELVVWCKVMNAGKIVLEQSFEGRAEGPAQEYRKIDSARQVIQKSADEAFQQAFTSLQKTLREKTAGN
jgi:hypothetical protein